MGAKLGGSGQLLCVNLKGPQHPAIGCISEGVLR